MKNDSDRTRRRLLRTAGLTAVTGVFAGCLDESTTDTDPDGSTDDGDDDPGTGDEADGNDGSTADGSDGDAASNGDGTDDADDPDSDTNAEDGETEPTETDHEYEMEPGTTVELRSLAMSWEGVAPSKIEGVENPTLILREGEDYTITWTENEQGAHNLAVYDDSESAVVGPTEVSSADEPGLSLEFEASSDTAEYVCEPHYTVGMAGSIEVQTDR